MLPRTGLRAIALLLTTSAVALEAQSARPATPFTVVETSIPQLQAALAAKRVTSRQLVEQYLIRIATYDRTLHATITVNPRALQEADALDRERAQGKLRGPLHGIPVALKDNIHTTDMRTTGGALAFADLVPPYDATLTKNLRDAGAIIIAKAQLTELANWVASGMPGNYNAVNGQGLNPWDPRPDPREGLNDGRAVLGTGGSSSGTGTNVSFWAGNVGTETSGSILSPSHANMLVGIKPTVGRISRYGVIPITADQDTPGPMTRTVADAAIMLGAMEGAAPDPNDAATKVCTPPANRDYTPFLKADALKGARIGIPRAFFYDTITSGGSSTPRGGLSAAQRSVMAEVIEVLTAQGATLVDPVVIPSISAKNADDNLLDWNPCSGLEQARGRDASCSMVLKYGMKRDFNIWLATLGSKAPVTSLTALRQWNIAHQRAGSIKYGQAQLDISDELDVRLDRERYEADRRKDIRLTADQGIDAAMKSAQLDALLFPGVSSANIAARPGYPSITVPYALLPVTAPTSQPFPAGFDPKPAPFGVTFTGGACAEPKLIALAYAFEQATKKRMALPQFR
ncbi:amidase family protein [Gemmatimonas sp.]|jgi:amidase|uniref:amidase family protein n=1 Tax=Gemmatimonas sp. TaxID=1962908 RepID=UPI0037BEC045